MAPEFAPHDDVPAPIVSPSAPPGGDPAVPLLSVEGLRAGYGRITALHSVDLTVGAGEVVAMLGANGAGKSTTLRAISSMVRPTAGTVRFDGRDVTRLPGDVVARRGLAHVPEGRRPLPRLTVRENLRLGAFGRRGREVDADMDGVFDRFERLRGRSEQKAGTLSGGEQQMLVIGRALMSRPKMMMLDEPSLGLSPVLVQEVFRMIRELAAEGLTVLLVEQNVVQALGVADRGYVLSTGRVTGHGTSQELIQDPALLTSTSAAAARWRGHRHESRSLRRQNGDRHRIGVGDR